MHTQSINKVWWSLPLIYLSFWLFVFAYWPHRDREKKVATKFTVCMQSDDLAPRIWSNKSFDYNIYVAKIFCDLKYNSDKYVLSGPIHVCILSNWIFKFLTPHSQSPPCLVQWTQCEHVWISFAAKYDKS